MVVEMGASGIFVEFLKFLHYWKEEDVERMKREKIKIYSSPKFILL